MKATLPTVDEVNAMRKGDREVINRLYMVNYDFIMTVCKAYCRSAQIKNGLYEDMTQECYLYFEKFEFSSVSAFIRNIRDICVYVRWGGEKTFHQVRQGNTEILTILDEPATKNAKHSDEGLTVGDTIASDVDLLDEIEPPPDYTEVVHDVAVGLLSDREKTVFDYFYYTDITAKDVGVKTGFNINTVFTLKRRARLSLQKHAEEFREKLLLAGFPQETLNTRFSSG